jgi:hypothetical protein
MSKFRLSTYSKTASDFFEIISLKISSSLVSDLIVNTSEVIPVSTFII